MADELNANVLAGTGSQITCEWSQRYLYHFRVSGNCNSAVQKLIAAASTFQQETYAGSDRAVDLGTSNSWECTSRGYLYLAISIFGQTAARCTLMNNLLYGMAVVSARTTTTLTTTTTKTTTTKTTTKTTTTATKTTTTAATTTTMTTTTTTTTATATTTTTTKTTTTAMATKTTTTAAAATTTTTTTTTTTATTTTTTTTTTITETVTAIETAAPKSPSQLLRDLAATKTPGGRKLFTAEIFKCAGAPARDLQQVGFGSRELSLGGYTSAELTAAGFAPEAAASAAGVSSCPPGNYFNLQRKRCWPCLGGTYAAEQGYRSGPDDNPVYPDGCPDRCDEGYTSKAGATSKDQCRLGYKLMEPNEGAADSRRRRRAAGAPAIASCEGAFQLESECPWSNQGYMYIVTKEECEFAAGLMTEARLLNASKLYNRADLVCGGGGDNGTTAKTVSTDGFESTCAEGTPSVTAVAPVGYCGVEVDASGNQRLVFYEEAGDTARQHYQGHKLLAVCKVKECNEMEEIQGSGSKRPTAPDGKSRAPARVACAPCGLRVASLAAHTWRMVGESAHRMYAQL